MIETQRLTDKDINLIIEDQLAQDEGIAAHLVDVETGNGIVSLTGSVDTLLALDRAIELIEPIRGVRAIVNQLEVRPIARPSEQIQQDIEVENRLRVEAASRWRSDRDIKDDIEMRYFWDTAVQTKGA